MHLLSNISGNASFYNDGLSYGKGYFHKRAKLCFQLPDCFQCVFCIQCYKLDAFYLESFSNLYDYDFVLISKVLLLQPVHNLLIWWINYSITVFFFFIFISN